jgi:hypothetical protein
MIALLGPGFLLSLLTRTSLGPLARSFFCPSVGMR